MIKNKIEFSFSENDALSVHGHVCVMDMMQIISFCVSDMTTDLGEEEAGLMTALAVKVGVEIAKEKMDGEKNEKLN